MQTFLPYPDFVESARCLDYQRLGKQRSEAKTIILTIDEGRSSWANHPAVNMWRGYVNALRLYHDTVVVEWIKRGYKNNMELFGMYEKDIVFPPWLGDPLFHASHRAALMFKDPYYYGRYGWEEGEFYLWPYWTNEEKTKYELRNPKE